MKQQPEDALRRFYDACAIAPVPNATAPKPARKVATSFRWILAGPVAVLVMLTVVSALPNSEPSPGLAQWMMIRQARALGLIHTKPDSRRSESRSKQCNV